MTAVCDFTYAKHKINVFAFMPQAGIMGIAKGNGAGKRTAVPGMRENPTRQPENKFRNGGTQNDTISKKPV